MTSSVPHRIMTTLLVLIIAWAILTLVAFVVAERLIFMPPAASYGVDDGAFSRIAVGSGDSVAVVHLPNPSARYTILFSHGNAEDLGHLLPLLEMLRAAGFGVIAYDYRGYGRSSAGPPSVRKAVEDAEAVYRFATDDLGVGPDRLLLHGRSLGSGPALELAAKHPVAGVILESAFTSTYRVLTRVALLPFDRFPNARRIRQIDAPVLVIHGTADRVIPPAHGRSLFALAREPKQSLWVEGAGHNDVAHVARSAYVLALARFADMIDARSAETGSP